MTTLGSEKNGTSTDDITLSSRGMRALVPSLPYFTSYFKALVDPCDVEKNPEGRIALCMAENKLVQDELSTRLQQTSVASTAFSGLDNYCYNSMNGMFHVREAIAGFLTRKFLQPALGSDDALQADNVVLGSGAAGLLNWMFFSLCEEGEGCLIPAPYYAAFESDMGIVAQCVPVPVQLSNPSDGPTTDELELAFSQAAEKNIKIKTLLLTNPTNPMGTIYSPEIIANAIEWARSRKLHTIVDEIYGLSVHDQTSAEFESVTKTLNNQFGNDVHFLWALSKDLGSSGFRFGILYTQNEKLKAAIGNLNSFSCISHPIQAVVAEILSDEEFIDGFLEKSSNLLRSSYSIITEALENMKIPFVPAKAGIFVYCDFSSLLPVQSFEGEARFAALVEEGARIVMTPGKSQRDSKPGMFRICYAWVNQEVLQIAIKRLTFLSTDIRKSGWEGIDDSKTYYKIDAY